MTQLNDEELAELRRAVELLESPSLLARLSGMIGSPVERLAKRLPAPVTQQIQGAAEAALHKAADVALRSLGNTPRRAASTRLHKLYAGGVGAFGGAFGLPGQLVELPVSTTLMLRAVADVARSEGFDLRDLPTRQACIEVFAMGGPSDEDDAVESGYYVFRGFTAEAIRHLSRELGSVAAQQGASTIVTGTPARFARWLAMLIQKVAERFGVVITSKVVAQAMPVIGAATGAAINTLFVGYYQQIARGHFTVLRLERAHGPELIEREYRRIARQR